MKALMTDKMKKLIEKEQESLRKNARPAKKKPTVSKKETVKKKPYSAFDEAAKQVRKIQRKDRATMDKINKFKRSTEFQDLYKALERSAEGKLEYHPIKPVVRSALHATRWEGIKLALLISIPTIVTVLSILFLNHGA